MILSNVFFKQKSKQKSLEGYNNDIKANLQPKNKKTWPIKALPHKRYPNFVVFENKFHFFIY